MPRTADGWVQSRRADRRRGQLEARRACYATLSVGTRDLANVMTKVLHALESSGMTQDLRSDLDRARREHRMRRDLDAARESLNQLWEPLWKMRHVMRVDLGITEPDDQSSLRPPHLYWSAPARLRPRGTECACSA